MWGKILGFSFIAGVTAAYGQVPQSTQQLPAPPPTEQPSGSAAPANSEKTERVEVTGSHIKRIAVEGPSPVQTINRKEIEKTGYNSVGDVLRDISANSFGSLREASGSNAAGNAEVSLRGLGSDNTLVLLNGTRLPTDAVTGAVDLNLIPMAAVERIEVLKDGASAIYGSDALGGVVNIITRKDFSGNEIDITQDVPQLKGGAKTDLSIVNGINHEQYNMVNVFQYRNNDHVMSKDRTWTNHNISTTGSPGSYRSQGGKWNADVNCPAGMVIHSSVTGDVCSFNTSDYSSELPALRQYSILSETNYEVNSDLKVVGRVIGTQRKVGWNYAPAPVNPPITVPASVADHLGPGGTVLPGATAGQPLDIKYRLMDLGNRDQMDVSNSYDLILGGTYQMNPKWALDLTLSHDEINVNMTGTNGYARSSVVQNLITTGAFNPFANPGSRGSLQSARYNPSETTNSQLSSVDVKASGEFGEISGGPIGVAVGTTLMDQRYSDVYDDISVQGDVIGGAGSSGHGSREAQAAYTEFSLPLTKQIELQLAARYDHYSDFGDSANPKVAALYHVTPSLMVRGSVGTGFRAPLMQQLYAAASDGNPTFIDHVACNYERSQGGDTSECQPEQYNVKSSGNTGLKAEKSISYDAGVVYEPSSDFNIGGDLFFSKINNVVGIDYDDMTAAEAKGIDLSKYGISVNRDSGTQTINYVTAPLQNLSQQEITGIDLTGSYTMGRYKLSTDHAQMFWFKEEGFPGVGLRNKLGEIGRPAWKNTTSLMYFLNQTEDLTLSGLTTAQHRAEDPTYGELPVYTTYDLVYSRRSKKIGDISFTVKNLLGTTPPLDTSALAGQLDTSLYDQIGRQFIVGYKKGF